MDETDQIRWLLFFAFIVAWFAMPIGAHWLWRKLRRLRNKIRRHLRARDAERLGLRVRRERGAAFNVKRRY